MHIFTSSQHISSLWIWIIQLTIYKLLGHPIYMLCVYALNTRTWSSCSREPSLIHLTTATHIILAALKFNAIIQTSTHTCHTVFTWWVWWRPWCWNSAGENSASFWWTRDWSYWVYSVDHNRLRNIWNRGTDCWWVYKKICQLPFKSTPLGLHR